MGGVELKLPLGSRPPVARFARLLSTGKVATQVRAEMLVPETSPAAVPLETTLLKATLLQTTLLQAMLL